ncbi:MAG: hypothetical protein RR998_09365 [Oscillospiraceae bacterium]
METRRIKYRIQPTSSATGIAAALSVMSACCLGVVYWSVFAKYYTARPNADHTLTAMTVMYGVVIGCLLLFALFTGALGKRTMAVSAMLAMPVCLYYAIEKSGIRQMLLFPNAKGVFGVYADNANYFSGENLGYIVITSLFAIFAMISFWSIVFNHGRPRGFATFMLVIAAIVRVLFAIHDVRANALPLLESGVYTTAEFAFAILGHTAAVLFFMTLMILAIELRKEIIDDAETEEIVKSPSVPGVSYSSAPAAQSAPTQHSAPSAESDVSQAVSVIIDKPIAARPDPGEPDIIAQRNESSASEVSVPKKRAPRKKPPEATEISSPEKTSAKPKTAKVTADSTE